MTSFNGFIDHLKSMINDEDEDPFIMEAMVDQIVTQHQYAIEEAKLSGYKLGLADGYNQGVVDEQDAAMGD